MLGSGKTRAAGAIATASSPRSQAADVYRRYAAALYWQALLARDDPAWAEHVGCDVITDESALAAIAEHGEDDAPYRRTHPVLRRCRELTVGLAWQIRRPGRAAVAEDDSQVRTSATGRQ
jgi:hypothetical protein